MRNIIWIIVDSVRNYRSNAENIDDRGRIELMDELSDSWVDFKNVVTSAPSTVMSVGAMFTSCPAYYLGANFVDLRLNFYNRPHIGTVLRHNGYHMCCITLGPYEREAFDGIVDIVPRKLWPRGAKHRYEWNNYQVNDTLLNVLAHGLKRPFFLYVHYNCRGDEKISENVGLGLNRIEKAGLLSDSIVLLTSDHGYPDPVRSKEIEKLKAKAGLKRHQVAHDLILTEDNILVPLLLKAPGIESTVIKTQVCTLDYLPTSLSLAGMQFNADQFWGTDLTPLIMGKDMPQIEERIVRVDGRFLAQTGRVTALRRKDFKYIKYHDDMGPVGEQLYSLENDLLETENLIHNYDHHAETIEFFRSVFSLDQKRAEDFHHSMLKGKYETQINKLIGADLIEKVSSVSLIQCGVPGFDSLAEKILATVHKNATICSVASTDVDSLFHREFDLCFIILAGKLGNRSLFRKLAKVNATYKIISDLNMNVTRYTTLYPLWILWGHWIKRKYYIKEPAYLLFDLLATIAKKTGLPVRKQKPVISMQRNLAGKNG